MPAEQCENEREKLNKLKEVYLSLRDEHVKLLRGVYSYSYCFRLQLSCVGVACASVP